MDFLPVLDIQEDLDLLEEEEIDIIQEDLSLPVMESKPVDIFIGKPTNGKKVSRPTNKKVVKISIPIEEDTLEEDLQNDEPVVSEDIVKEVKVKKKRPITEKQKAHLVKIRAKAVAAKKEKTRLRKIALEKVDAELKEQKKTYKKRTVKVKEEIDIAEEEEVNPEFKKRVESTSEAARAKAHQTREKIPLTEQESFMKFMNHMETYKVFKSESKAAFRESKERRQVEQPKLVSKRPHPPTKPIEIPHSMPSILQVKDKNPYSNIFAW